MFSQIYSNIKEGYQRSWLRFFFKYTALGELLEQDTKINALTFYDTYLSSWWWNRLWFRACIQDTFYLTQFDNILKSLWLLEKAGMLTQENLVLVANHANPELLYFMLYKFQQAVILNFDDILKSLWLLEKAGMLTQENLVLFANHASLSNLNIALSYLQNAEILTQENFVLSANHANSDKLMSMLCKLQQAEILTQENFVLVANHANPELLFFILGNLQRVRILTQENFDVLVEPNHTALISEETERLIWSRIPFHLLTQDNFERLVTASEHANPMEELQRALNLILALDILADHNLLGVPAPAAAFNQEQSTHTASVHRSVSESAVRLMTSYGAGLNLAGTIQKIEAYVNSLDDSLEHQAAKNCIARLTRREYSFTDSSGVSTRQLLALAYTAIHDETKRQGTLKDAQALFV